MSLPGFWDNQSRAQATIEESNQKKQVYEEFVSLDERLQDAELGLELLKEEPDEDLFNETVNRVKGLTEDIERYELNLLLDHPHDHANAIVELHPGAGGTESQDWGSMLLRMYTRWSEKHQFQVEMIDYQNGDEAGIKSVTMLVKGLNAYGYLKAEKGVHRMVRISPFDAAGKRHTSFCSVDIVPEIVGEIDIEISSDELKIDTFRASGAGGQHINKTDSAVRITHLPTGIVTQSQSQRSQLQNRETAMNLLKAKLIQREEEEREKELAQIRGEQLEIGWGSQIRNYVFHPYSMVKDVRTAHETSAVDQVMDGDLDGFIDAYLKWKLSKSNTNDSLN